MREFGKRASLNHNIALTSALALIAVEIGVYAAGGKRRRDERLKPLFSVRAFRRAIDVGSTRDFHAQSLAIGP